MSNEENSVMTTESVIEESVATANNNKGYNTIDYVIATIAKAIKDLVRTSDAKDAEQKVQDIVATIFTLNSLDEYAIGVRVKGDLYRYSDYECPAGLRGLIVPAKVVVVDNSTARNFIDSKSFKTERFNCMTPAEFKLAVKKVCSYLRINPELQAISRPSVGLLSEATKYAVNGRKVGDAKQASINFLTIRCDDEAKVNISEWCQTIVVSLFQ